MNDASLIQLALDAGFSATAIIDIKDIVFDPSFRPYCEENLCGHYGANYSCPPDCGTAAEMEERLKKFKRALVVQSKWPITDYGDTAAIKHAKAHHNSAMLAVIAKLQESGANGLMCGASSCTLCERCAILDEKPCKFPLKRFSCLSAYCVFVRKLAEASCMEYVCSDGSLAFFGLWAF